MMKQDVVIDRKYCYLFQSEDLTPQHLKDIFGTVEDLCPTLESAKSEMENEKVESPKWFKEMEEKLGRAVVVEVLASQGELLSYKKLDT